MQQLVIEIQNNVLILSCKLLEKIHQIICWYFTLNATKINTNHRHCFYYCLLFLCKSSLGTIVSVWIIYQISKKTTDNVNIIFYLCSLSMLPQQSPQQQNINLNFLNNLLLLSWVFFWHYFCCSYYYYYYYFSFIKKYWCHIKWYFVR